MSATIDLSLLPRPTVIEPLSYQSYLDEMQAVVVAALPDLVLTEADPAMKVLRICAGFRLSDRQAFNDDAVSRMLAYAVGPDLDHLGVLVGVERFTITPADPETDTPAVMEADDDYRQRIANGLDAFSVAGPQGAYVARSRAAHPDVLDASADAATPDDIRAVVMSVLADHEADSGLIAAMETALDESRWPGDVDITLLARSGDGTASPEVIASVDAALSAEDVRPMTDNVIVSSAEIIPYAVEATYRIEAGPDGAVVEAAMMEKAEAYAAYLKKLGRDVTTDGWIAALRVAGVTKLNLISPAADIIMSDRQAGHCTGITLSPVGVGE